MKKIDNLFDFKELADRVVLLRKEEDGPAWGLLVPIIEGVATLEKIEKLFKDWAVNEKELPPNPDPAARWQLFTRLANGLVEKIRARINRILEKQGEDTFHGEIEFRMVLDGSFGLYCNTEVEIELNGIPHAGDVIVERLADGSYIIEEHDGEALGMAHDWKNCVEFVADHFDGAGYWDPEFEYQINVFQREEGKLYLVNFDEFMTEEESESEDEGEDAS